MNNMWQKPIAITIDGITHSSVRKCCEYYGIKPNTVFNKMRRKKISATDAILDSIRPTYEVDGMKFNRIVDMAAYYHIPRATLGYRLLRGWSIEDAVHLPTNGRGIKRHGKQILKRYRIGNEYGTARELSEKYGIVKKCKDHKGNEFNSIVEMCDYWHISPYCYYLRTKKLNWEIKKALTTPQREKKTKTDNVCELLQRHGIIRKIKTFNKLLKDGYTIEQAIAEIKQQIADEIKERAKML